MDETLAIVVIRFNEDENAHRRRTVTRGPGGLLERALTGVDDFPSQSSVQLIALRATFSIASPRSYGCEDGPPFPGTIAKA